MRNKLLTQAALVALAFDRVARVEAPEPAQKRYPTAPSPTPEPVRWNPHESRNARRDQIRRNGGKR